MSRRCNCHDNAVAESFSRLLKREGIKKKISGTREEPAVIFLITSKCFITISVGMVLAIKCHRRNTKINIANGPEVSKSSVAIHFFFVVYKKFCISISNGVHLTRFLNASVFIREDKDNGYQYSFDAD